MTLEQLKKLFYEQWEQTPAHGEGDIIYVNAAEEMK